QARRWPTRSGRQRVPWRRVPMKPALLGVAFVALASAVRAGDKPVVYNHADTPPSQLDHQVETALAPNFTVVDVPEGAAYVEAKFLAGDLPKTAKTDSGESLSGYALVAYVIGTDGHASGLAVIETTEPRLEPFVAQAMHDWRFTPASIDGKP